MILSQGQRHPWDNVSTCCLLDEPTRQYEGPLHHYRSQQESPSPQQQPPPPPSSQAEGMGQVPRTHRLITLADHICVSLFLLLLYYLLIMQKAGFFVLVVILFFNKKKNHSRGIQVNWPGALGV